MAAKLGTVGEYVYLWDKGSFVVLTVMSSCFVRSQYSELDCEDNQLEVSNNLQHRNKVDGKNLANKNIFSRVLHGKIPKVIVQYCLL